MKINTPNGLKEKSLWHNLDTQSVGGNYICLPQYITIDRKPENGCEIQNADDGVSVIMMQLNLVNT